MQAAVQDFYKTILEKRAQDISPDYGTNNQSVALRELEANKADQREQLGDLLSSASKAQKDDTASMGKALPEARKSKDTTTSSPMLKVAMHQAFFSGLRDTGVLKTASPDYLRVAFQAFEDELEKIGAWTGTSGHVLRAALNAAKKKPGVLKPKATPNITRVGGGRGAGVWKMDMPKQAGVSIANSVRQAARTHSLKVPTLPKITSAGQ